MSVIISDYSLSQTLSASVRSRDQLIPFEPSSLVRLFPRDYKEKDVNEFRLSAELDTGIDAKPKRLGIVVPRTLAVDWFNLLLIYDSLILNKFKQFQAEMLLMRVYVILIIYLLNTIHLFSIQRRDAH